MFYRRSESFRYTFGEPLDATFRLIKLEQRSKPDSCLLIDISPGGMRIFSVFTMPVGTLLELEYTLHQELLGTTGTIVWKKAHADGSMYGIDLHGGPDQEIFITNELKQYRRKEMEGRKFK